MTLSLFAASSIGVALISADVLAIAFISGASLLVGAIVYAIFTTGALQFDDDDATQAEVDRKATQQHGDARR